MTKRMKGALAKAVNEPMDMFPATVATPVLDLSKAGIQVRRVRDAEGLTVAALARLIGCRGADVIALEDGRSADWLDEAWEALQTYRDSLQPRQLEGGLCGFCGAVHGPGRCP